MSWSYYKEGRRVVITDMSTRTTPTVIGFFSKHTIFSNHFPCEMIYDKKSFKSSEHLYYYLRAVKFEDLSTAEAFRHAVNGIEVKELAKRHPL